MDDIKDYQDLKGTLITIDNIAVSAGTKIFATVRAYNKVGLHNIVTSDQITVSPNPVIEVLDGKGEKDADYQSDLHVIQGKFGYNFCFLLFLGQCDFMNLVFYGFSVNWTEFKILSV